MPMRLLLLSSPLLVLEKDDFVGVFLRVPSPELDFIISRGGVVFGGAITAPRLLNVDGNSTGTVTIFLADRWWSSPLLLIDALLLLLLAMPSRQVLLSVCVPVDAFIFAAVLGGVDTATGGGGVNGLMGEITFVGMTSVCGFAVREVSCMYVARDVAM